MDDPSEEELRARYEPKLRQELEELQGLQELSAESRRTVKLDQTSVGRLSRMDAMQQQAMAMAQKGRRQARLQGIDAALRRLDDGEFGWCVSCGEFIGFKRLDLDPLLPRCLDCSRAG